MEQLQLGDKRTPLRIFIYLFGVAFTALGAVLVVDAGIGAHPTQTVNNVLSLATGLSLGTWSFIMFSSYTLLQIPLQGKAFRPIQLLQIGMALFFGVFVDIWRFLLVDFQLPGGYFGQLAELALGMFGLASGVVIFRSMRLIDLPYEGLCAAVAPYLPSKEFHRARMLLDAILVATGVVLSLIFFGRIYSIREGTLITALTIGRMLPYIRQMYAPILAKIGFQVVA